MRYLSLFSGLAADAVAWTPLGWECVAFAEIDPSACAVLSHHHPDVTNLGDVRGIDAGTLGKLGPFDLIIFGFPCQDVSVAGKRAGLRNDDETVTRTGLYYEATRIVRLATIHNGCRWFVAENVPGLLSSDRGRDFSEILREITGLDFPAPEAGWGNAGIAARERGWSVAWSVLDAQFFGVPQRRRRVFLVGHTGDWTRPVQVLLESESLCGDLEAGREAGQGVANGVAGCLNSGGNDGGFRTEPGEHLVAAFGGNNTSGPIDVATACNAHGGAKGRLDFESETFIAHTLRADGFDASEDGTGRGTPLVPVKAWGISSDALDRSGEGDGSAAERAGLGIVDECSPALRARPNNAVAVSFVVNAAESCARASHARESETARCIDSTGSFANAQGGTVVMQPMAVQEDNQNGVTVRDTTGSLRADAPGTQPCGTLILEPTPIDMRQASRGEMMTNNRAEGSSGGAPGTGIGEPGDPAPSLSLSHPPAIAFQKRGRDGERNFEWQEDQSYALRAIDGGGCGDRGRIQTRSAVRRLTPLECERLQGLPNMYTLVPYRGKPMSDGPRYKLCGNSIAIPVLRWIGGRLAAADAIG